MMIINHRTGMRVDVPHVCESMLHAWREELLEERETLKDRVTVEAEVALNMPDERLGTRHPDASSLTRHQCHRNVVRISRRLSFIDDVLEQIDTIL